MDRRSLTTKLEERGYFDAIPARNRFLKLSAEESERALNIQSNIARDCMLAQFSFDRVHAAIAAEAAAHWAFMLHPELRANDDTFWSE